jgi:hypothetical protein
MTGPEFDVARKIEQLEGSKQHDALAKIRAECWEKSGGSDAVEERVSGNRLAGDGPEALKYLGQYSDCVKDRAPLQSQSVNVGLLVDNIMLSAAAKGSRTARMNVSGVSDSVVAEMESYMKERGLTFKIDNSSHILEATNEVSAK